MTRQGKNDPCQCSVCCLSRATLCQETKTLLDRYIEVNNMIPAPSQTVIKICVLCNGEIASEKPHVCTKTSFRVNTLNIVRQKSEKSRGRLTSELVKTHFNEQSTSTRGGTISLPGGGPNSVKITLGAEAAGLMKQRSFSHQDIIDIVGGRNLSDRTAW